ncbi:MAG: gamma-glutamyltransferase, partial [Pseudomonadota bacterium]
MPSLPPRFNHSWQIRKPAVRSSGGIVASQARAASEAGASILAAGGNAIDAAIATSFALGAVEPWMSGIGGGGYMVIRRGGSADAEVVEFGMRAPGALDPADYPLSGAGKSSDLFPWPSVVEDRNVQGPLSIAIPGAVAGMAKAHEAYGTLSWHDLLAPAVALAEGGLPVDWYTQLLIAGSAGALSKYPKSREAFLDAAGFPRASAWTALGQSMIDLSDLAKTLRHLAEEGAGAFYSGPLAESIVADLKAAGGCHRVEDFARYTAETVKAERFSYRDHTIFVSPRLTAGPTFKRVFQQLESNWKGEGEVPNAAAYRAYAKALVVANEERYATMGDMDESARAETCTSHFNVIDRDGTHVAVTQTLLSVFGSRMMLPSSGVLMNNGIMWFDPEPGKPNSLGPAKRCLTNMSPTVLERSDGARYALGASGGRKILPATVQISSYLLDYGMDLDSAFHHPRIDTSLAGTAIVDPTLPPEVG